ncbi:MAG: calcium/sodium antiporter [Alistipes sp.]|nr:calcium/sodium antiporter [Alistipes sp.]
MIWILLIIGLTLLTVGATWLTNGSAAIAKRLHVSEYVIGMTIVAIGTSLPELTVSTASTIAGNTDIAIGNVVGSNIFNVFLILGLCSLFKPILFTQNNIRRDVPICVAVSLLLGALVWNGTLSRIEGAIMLLLYIAVLWHSFKGDKQPESDLNEEENNNEASSFSWLRSGGMVILGLCGLIYGASLTLDSAIGIARSLGVSEAVIAITILAGGTSLPELAASLTALFKGHSALALGNVLGSNVANILLILGTCSTIAPLSMGGITMVDVAMAVAAAIVVLISALIVGHRRIMWCEGIVYLLCYGAYVWYLVK